MNFDFANLETLLNHLSAHYETVSGDELENWFAENRYGLSVLAMCWVDLREAGNLSAEEKALRGKLITFFETVDPLFLVNVANPTEPGHSRTMDHWEILAAQPGDWHRGLLLETFHLEGRIFTFLQAVSEHGFADTMAYMGSAYLHNCRNLLREVDRFSERIRRSEPAVSAKILEGLRGEFEAILMQFPEEVRKSSLAV